MEDNHKRMIPEYDLNNEATWVVVEPPPIDPSWLRALNNISGFNPFGEPNLIPRWGATYRDPMSEDNGLKYWLCNTESRLVGHAFRDPITGLEMMVSHLEEVPPTVLISIPKYESKQLGERRWMVEQWRSPEFLSRGGRYRDTMLIDAGTCYEFFFCKNCDTELLVDKEPLPCHECGSKRHYLREMRDSGEGKLLRDFPRHGCYDYFLRLENAEGKFMPLDGVALRHIEAEWHRQHNQTQQEKIDAVNKETAKQRLTNLLADNPSNPFIAPIAA